MFSKSMSRQSQGLIAINIAAVIFGSAALYGKLDVSPVWIVAMRAVFAAIALIILAKIRSQFAWPALRLVSTILITGVILTIHWLTFFFSVQMAGVAIATLTFAAFPLFTILIETLLRKRWPHALELVAGIAILAAVKLLVDVDLGGSNESLGAIAGLVSALAFAGFGVVSKKLAGAMSPLLISIYQNGVVAAVLIPFLPFISQMPHQGIDWLCLLLLGVFTTAVMHQLYFYALQRLSASICSGFVALEPVYAIVFAALFFHEPITLWVVISGLLIVGASILLLYYDMKVLKLK